jgi:hypothetical protein
MIRFDLTILQNKHLVNYKTSQKTSTISLSIQLWRLPDSKSNIKTVSSKIFLSKKIICKKVELLFSGLYQKEDNYKAINIF